MFAIAPVAILALLLEVGSVIKLSGATKAIPVLLAAKWATSRYRVGEGPLSDQTLVEITSENDIGKLVVVLGESVPEFQKFRGKELRLTKSEMKSLSSCLQAVGKGAHEPLLDFLEQFPR